MSKKKDYEARIAELEEKLKAKDSVDSAKADENRADKANKVKADKVKAEKKSFSQKIVDAMGFSSKPKGMSLDNLDDDDFEEKEADATAAVVAGSEVPKEVPEVAEDAPEEEAPVEPVTVESNSDDSDELDALTADELRSMAEDMEQKVLRARQKLSDGEAKVQIIKKKAKAKAKAEAEAAAEAEAKAKAEAEAKAKAETEAKSEAEAEVRARQPISTPSISQDGPVNAYRFWSSAQRSYLLTTDLWIAEQLSPGDWKTVKVWMKGGQIDHILTEEEIVKYYNLL